MEKKPIIGVVTDCMQLRVRRKPSTGSEVICLISTLSEVMVDLEQSTDNWYKICHASGIEGYCKKKYVALRRSEGVG